MNNIYIYIIITVNKHSVDNAIQYNTQIHPRFPFRLFGNSDTVPVASPTPPLRQGAQGSIHRRRRRYHLRGMRGIQGLDTWKIWEIGQPKWFFHMF